MNPAILILVACAFPAFAADSWPHVKFTEVRAYAWPDDGKHTKEENVILSGTKLKPGVINPDGALLSAEQVTRLREAVSGSHARHGQALCYFPHNAFVFYNAARKPVAFVELCFACLGYRSSPKGAAEWFDMLALAKLFDELKLPMGEYPDFATFKKERESHLPE